MNTEVLNVTGVTCGGCVANVERALGALPGVTRVAVSLPRNQVQVEYDERTVDARAVREALQSAGYDVSAMPVPRTRSSGCCS